jgi:hypothetical protein
MGRQGTGVFDLDDKDHLLLVHHTLCSAQEVDDDELDVDLGVAAMDACEVVARLRSRQRRRDEAAGAQEPSPALIQLATSVLDRLASQPAVLDQLVARDRDARTSLQDLRRRLVG